MDSVARHEMTKDEYLGALKVYGSWRVKDSELLSALKAGDVEWNAEWDGDSFGECGFLMCRATFPGLGGFPEREVTVELTVNPYTLERRFDLIKVEPPHQPEDLSSEEERKWELARNVIKVTYDNSDRKRILKSPGLEEAFFNSFGVHTKT